MKEPRKMLFKSRAYNSLKDAYRGMVMTMKGDYICDVTFTQIMDGKWQYKVTYISKNDILKEDKHHD